MAVLARRLHAGAWFVPLQEGVGAVLLAARPIAVGAAGRFQADYVIGQRRPSPWSAQSGAGGPSWIGLELVLLVTVVRPSSASDEP
ncbi:MAG: hypothetical protein IPK42_05975 [Betaproteobacteria bacterium]|nr:hypothetical protein [Betaproteobacteria bacterium]